ncbi:L-threonate dehydrogenase [Taklimakanibacter deserti]|uniref:L-threonate dehydrogenase n=1 Tax=Taklimakanibacter deserti TaxID=2267839 RepID=UPI000E65D767
MTPNPRPVACVIGLGSMGMGAALSLLRAGIEVRGVDVRPEALTRLKEAGGFGTTSAGEGAKGADAVLTFVVNAEQTQTVLFGADGAAAALSQGSLVISCATVPPSFAEELARQLNGKGLLALDAPVSGGSAKAEAGEMTIMASGAAAAFEKAEPFLGAIASKVYRLGDAPGAGSRVKMINQLLAGVHIAVAAEAVALGIKAGIDPSLLYEVISNSAGSSWMFQNRVPHMISGDYTPRSAVDIFVKDLGIVLEAGRVLDFPLPIASTAHRLFAEAAAMGLGREDDAAVVKVYSAEAGLPLPSAKD